MNTPKLLTLSKGLGQCYVRLGGTRGDYSTFYPETNVRSLKTAAGWNGCTESRINNTILEQKLNEINEASNYFTIQKRLNGFRNTDLNITFTGKQWDKINNFTTCVNWKLIFGLNFLTKQKNGSWDPTNAEELFAYSQKRKYKIDWELGNEPNSFPHKSGVSYSPQQLADGFLKLRATLNKYNYQDSLIIGPDTNDMFRNTAQSYFKSFLVAAKPVVDRATFHQYYTAGKTATLANFTDPILLDKLNYLLKKTKKTASKVAPNIPLWLGETSSTYGGGTPNISDSYASGFLWLNKLGMAAKYGISMVIRQTLLEGNYALLNKLFDPRPDYWLTLLYKRLVGAKVFNVTLTKFDGNEVTREYGQIRIFAHCAKEKQYEGGLTVYFVNLSNRTLHLKLSQIGHIAYTYMLSPGLDGLTSKNVYLNGKLLKLVNDHALPTIKPNKIRFMGESNIKMARKSFGFIVFPNANIDHCFKEILYQRNEVDFA